MFAISQSKYYCYGCHCREKTSTDKMHTATFYEMLLINDDKNNVDIEQKYSQIKLRQHYKIIIIMKQS